MTEREVRMRAVEAVAQMGVREAGRLTTEADKLTKWVMAGDDNAPARRQASKSAD